MGGISGLRSMWLVGAVALAVALGGSTSATEQGPQERYEALDELPSTASDVEDIEPTAIALVEALDGVPTSEDPSDRCPEERLEVSWEEPEGFERGAYIGEVGPPPTEDTTEVVGVIVCEGSNFAFESFEAVQQDDGSFELSIIPEFAEGSEEIASAEQRSMDHMAGEVPDQEVGIREGGDLRIGHLGELRELRELREVSLLDLGPIDPYALYQPQRLCHPDPKPGTVALGQLLLDLYPDTRNHGIGRDCDIGGRSEHKEGRAFDWGARVTDPDESAAVEDFFDRLLATDEDGNRHALARRMGVMYLIWDGKIWSSYRADEGWRPYNGPSAHVDHVHISLSWDGAMGQTSFWRAVIDEGTLASIPALAMSASPPTTDVPYRWSSTDAQEFRAATPDEAPADREQRDDEPVRDDSSSTEQEQEQDQTSDDGGTVDDLVDGTEDTVDDTEDTIDETVDDTEETIDDTVDDTEDTIDDTIDDVDDSSLTDELDP